MKKKFWIIIIAVLIAGGFGYYKYSEYKQGEKITSYLKSEYGSKCSISYDALKNQYTLTYIDSGYKREDLKSLFKKNDPTHKQWNYIVDKYRSKSSEIKHDIKDKYKKDVNVEYICNDEDNELLISAVNGKVEDKYF